MFGLTARVAAAVDEWTRLGPDGGDVRSLAVDPSNPAVLYAGLHFGGAYRSADGEASWTRIAAIPADATIDDVVVHPTDSRFVVARAPALGLYRSVDGGESWTFVPYINVKAVALDPTDADVVYIGVGGGGVRKSTDGGLTFSPTGPGFQNVPGTAIAVAPDGVVYAGTHTLGGFKSIDGGATWTAMGDLPLWVYELGLSPHDPNVLFAAASAPFGEQYVYKSTNAGASWSLASSGLPETTIGGFAFDAVDPNLVWAATTLGPHRSSNGGGLWVPRTTGLGDLKVEAIAGDPGAAGVLYASADGVAKTVDGGQLWSPAGAGLAALTVIPARDPANADVLWAATSRQLWRSNDGGQTWPYYRYFAAGGMNTLLIDPTNSNRILIGVQGAGVRRSDDGGGSWSTATVLSRTDVGALALAPSAPNVLYAGTGDGVYKSTSYGNSWVRASTGIASPYTIYALAVDPHDANLVYAGTQIGGLYRSTDGAASWTRVWNTTLQVWGLLVDPSESQTLYARMQSVGVYKSTNGGSSWVSRNAGMPMCNTTLAIDPLTPSTLYCGSAQGIYRSTDAALSWNPMPAAGLQAWVTNRIVVDPLEPSIVFASSPGGVYVLEQATPTATPTHTSTRTATPTITATRTATPTPADTATRTETPTPADTATRTETPTPADTETPTPSATATETPTPADTATPTPSATATETPTPSATDTETPMPSATETPAWWNGCPPAPRPGCMPATGASLKVVAPLDAGRRRLTWTWQGTLSAPALGNPITDTPYSLCLYNRGGLLSGVAVPAGTLWSTRQFGGYKYRDPGAASGAYRVVLDPRRGHVAVKGKGGNLPAPPLPLAAPVELAAQWARTDTGACWEMRAGAAHVRRNDALILNARR